MASQRDAVWSLLKLLISPMRARSARFEAQVDADRDLIRSLARRLAKDNPDASRLRAAVSQTIAGEPLKKGDILAALRRSPLVGAGLDLTRSREKGTKIRI